MPTRWTEAAAGWLPWAALAVVVLSIAAGAWQHWTLSLPVAGAVRLAAWLLRGIYLALPLLAVGAVIVRCVDPTVLRLPMALAAATCVATGSAVVVLVGIAMLAARLYTPVVWQLAALASWLAGIGWLVAARWRPLLDLWTRLRQSARSRVSLLSWSALLLLVVGAAALHASLPPDTRDELSYHLVVPEMWAFQGDWWLPADNFHVLFPGNAELLWGWAAAIGGPLAPRFLTLLLAALTALLLAQWLEQTVADRWIRDVSLVFLLVTPALLTAAVICYVEWPMLLFMLLGWRLSRVGLNGDSQPRLIWPAAFWGVAAGMKYTAMLFVGLLALEWVVGMARRGRPKAAARAVVFGTVALALLAAPWLGRNLMATGDPVYPLGAVLAPAGSSPHDPSDLSDYADLQGVWRRVPWLYHATVETAADHRLHPLWPLLHLLIIATGWRWRRELPWLTVVGASLALAWFNPAPRIYLPLMLLVWLFLPRLLQSVSCRPAARLATNAAVVLVALVSLPITFYYLFISGGTAVPSYLIGLDDRAGFLAARGVVTPAELWVARHAEPDARIWAWCEDQTLYLARWTRADSPYGPPSFLVAASRGGGAALDEEVRDWSIDLVLLRRDRCPESFADYRLEKHAGSVEPTLRDTVARWAEGHLRELERDDRSIVYRVVR